MDKFDKAIEEAMLEEGKFKSLAAATMMGLGAMQGGEAEASPQGRPPVSAKAEMTEDAFLANLRIVENGIFKGYDKVTKTRTPYLDKDKDGPDVPTVGFGSRRINGKPVQMGDRFTKTQIENAMIDDYNHMKATCESHSKYPQFRSLPKVSQYIIIDMMYNGVMAPKFYKASIEGDFQGMLDESRTFHKGKPLTGRNNARREWLEQYYPNFPRGLSYSE